MKRDIDINAALRLGGGGVERPLAARRHRGVLATSHALDPRTQWIWKPQDIAADESIVGLAFADVPVHIAGDAGEHEVAADAAILLHPQRSTILTSSVMGNSRCLWLPWATVSEVEDGIQSPGQVLAMTPMLGGLRAFLGSILTERTEATPYSDYLLERILVEMAFGALIESVPGNIRGVREERLIDRARTLMLLRRGEPDFGVAELAQDLHVSTRQLQRTFAAADSSPADELRAMRVQMAAELLENSAYDSLTIAEIAMHAGFTSSAAMRRAFATRNLPMPARRRAEVAIDSEIV